MSTVTEMSLELYIDQVLTVVDVKITDLVGYWSLIAHRV